MTLSELKDMVITAITDSMPGEMDMVRDQDYANAADEILDIIFGLLTTREFSNMHDLIADKANVMIDETSRRLWVCTEDRGTVLRIKTRDGVSVDDRRIGVTQ
jgi:hypothetical protein